VKQRVIIIFCAIVTGCMIGALLLLFTPLKDLSFEQNQVVIQKNIVIGFLPYWLTDKAESDYSAAVTRLTYFDLTVDKDGTILHLDTPTETEPGWNALSSGKMDSFFRSAKKNGMSLSLTVFSGNNATIDAVLSKPIAHANNLARDVIPLMKKYGFSDLNLDIEKTNQASPEARLHFTQFVKTLKNQLTTYNAGTLTLDVTGYDLVKKNLIDVRVVGQAADYIVLMTYDYHFAGSDVTGPVAPLYGAGTISEYDVATAVQKALQILPSKKIILGVPLYGYEWETITHSPRSAVIPSSGVVASSQRVQQLMQDCSNCVASFDAIAQEPYITYKDQQTGTYHQIFYPNKKAIQAKTTFAQKNKLAGVALWALGYEDRGLLDPLQMYSKN
jgi:spore germination protein YaaH